MARLRRAHLPARIGARCGERCAAFRQQRLHRAVPRHAQRNRIEPCRRDSSPPGNRRSAAPPRSAAPARSSPPARARPSPNTPSASAAAKVRHMHDQRIEIGPPFRCVNPGHRLRISRIGARGRTPSRWVPRPVAPPRSAPGARHCLRAEWADIGVHARLTVGHAAL